MPFSRRHFLSLSLGTGLWASLGGACRRNTRDVLGKPGQQQTLAAYLDTLIPADEMPSATQLGVTEKILSQAATDSDYLRLLNKGCDWLEAQAQQSGAAHFAALSEDQRERVIHLAAAAEGGLWVEMFFDQTLAAAFSYYYATPGVGLHWIMLALPSRGDSWITPRLRSRRFMAQADFDVVIIGAGAGGGASAWALSRYGIRVLVLEAGPAYNPTADYRLNQTDWEQSRFPDKASRQGRYTFGPLQELEPQWQTLRSWNLASGPSNPLDQRLSGRYHHVRGLGGTTLHFTGEAHRLHPAALNMRSRFGVVADWPLDYAELEPFYCEAERIVSVAGPQENPVRVRSEPYPLPAHPLSYASSKIAAGCGKLGFTWVPNSVAALSAPYDGRPGCNYCAGCNRGCPRRDKGSVDVTFIRKALTSGYCTVETGCQVLQVEAGPSDKIANVYYVDDKGATQTVSGGGVIVACGAVETPRLLLASANRYAPDGLGNESGQVGRHFMETLAWTSSGLHGERLDSFCGLPSDSVCWDFNAPDAIPGVIGGCCFSPATAEADLLGPINYAQRVVPGWGRQHKAEMRRVFGRVLSVKAIGEFLPNENSFIDLDPDERDEFGIPLARINSYLDDMELRRLEFMAKTARDILFASGVEKIFEEGSTYDFFNSTHVFGTCRMGDDPQQSVVDRYGRSHRWRNLFIVDASVFPSSGGGEAPSLTIEALAIRTATTIRGLASKGEFSAP